MRTMKNSIVLGLIVGTGMAASVWLGDIIPDRNIAIIVAYILGIAACFAAVVREVLVILDRRSKPQAPTEPAIIRAPHNKEV